MRAVLALFLLFASGDTFDRLLRAGLSALNSNHLAEAQSQLEAAAKVEPRRPQVWMALAQTYFRLKKLQLADAAALKAATLGPADPVVLQGLAFYYSETGNFEKAAEMQTQYARGAPEDLDALARAAAYFLQAKKPENAISLVHQALAKEDRAELHELLAKAYAAAGKSDESVVQLQAALRARPYEENYYFELGEQLLRMQKFEAALATLDAGVKLFDKSAQLQLARGVALYGLRRFQDAIDSFLHTIQLAPEVEQPYVFLGRMLEVGEDRTPRITQALAAFAQSQPNRYISSFLYAKALSTTGGNADEIESLLRKSIGLKNDFWESHFELGLILERRHAFDDAAKELERSIELNPSEPVPHYRLARVYDRLGKANLATQQREIHSQLSAASKAGTAAVK